MLVVFQSDSSTAASGFHFTYARCSGGADDGGTTEYPGTQPNDYYESFDDIKYEIV